jgi:nucleotide-binding universal stress UspA family protein
VDRIEDLAARLERALDRAETSGHAASFVGVARELRSSVELLAKLSGELKPDGPTVQVLNLQASPDWVATRSALMAALQRHPEALADVAAALARLEGTPNVRAVGPGGTP